MEDAIMKQPASATPGDFSTKIEQVISTVYEKLPPEDKESVERVVLAGQKVMFSQETHKFMIAALSKQGDMDEKLSVGMIQFVIVLLQQAKGNIPPNVMIPAAVILLSEACKYVDRTQGGMTMDIFGDASSMMIAGIYRKVEEAQGQTKGQPAGQPEAMPEGQPQPPQAAPQGLMQAGVV